jgi:hypothetical protein
VQGAYPASESRESAVPTPCVRIHSRLVADDSTPRPFKDFHNGYGLSYMWETVASSRDMLSRLGRWSIIGCWVSSPAPAVGPGG